MRKAVVIVFAFILFACGNNPGKVAIRTTISTEKTTVKFEEKMHNFGSLTAGEIVVYTFKFTNTGNANYLIDKIHSDCGCVKTSYTKEGIKPGKTGIIELEFDSSGMVGKEFKTIEIHGNSKELKHLAIFAEVKNEILKIKY